MADMIETKKKKQRTDRHIPLRMYYEAYYSFRRHCRDTEAQQAFEASYAYNLFCIRRDVTGRHIALGTSYAFIVKKPCPREVFAGSIYKRILDSLCIMILRPCLDGHFSSRHFNVRKGYGLLQYQQQLYKDMREVTKGYGAKRTAVLDDSGGAWILGGDISSYFMSMDKDVVWRKWETVIKVWYGGEYTDELLYIMKEIVYYEPEKHCIRKSPIGEWKLIKPNKSLFTNGDGKGMPIGDPMSQCTALLLLQDFCMFLEDSVEKVGVYMDDWYAIGNHNELLALLPLARDKLKEVSLKLNEHKTYLQPIRHGLKTCGCFAYPDRVYVSNRVVNNAWQTMLYYNDHLRGDAIRFCQRMNSYFGTLSHFKTYRIRKELVHLVPTEWWDKVYVEGHYEKFAIRKNNQLKKSMNKVNAFARNRTFGN